MPADYVIRTIPVMRVVAQVAVLAPEELSRHIEPMFDAVGRALTGAGASLATPVATYARTEGGMDVSVGHVCAGPAPAGLQVIDLPQTTAVCGVHHGPMTGIQQSWMRLLQWVTELQQPITPR